jgi:hypothetical protein
VGWVVFALALAELLATASGLWPSASALVMLYRQPEAAISSPLVYWSEYRPGVGELLYFVAMVFSLGVAGWLMSGSDTPLWRTPLLAAEARRGWSLGLRIAFAVLCVDLFWRAITLGAAGALPVQFRFLVAAAAAATLAHAWLRIRTLTQEHYGFDGSLVSATVAVVAYVVITIGFSGFSAFERSFLAVNGELKALQLAAALLSSSVLGAYLYFAAFSQTTPDVEPAALGVDDLNGDVPPADVLCIHEGQIDPRLRRYFPYVVEIAPSGAPFVAFGPSQGGAMPAALGVIGHGDVGRLVPYRDAGGELRLVARNRLMLSIEPHLILDLDAIASEYRGIVELRVAQQRNKWLEGRLHWSLELPYLDVPERMPTTAWQTLRQKLANRDEVIVRIQSAILQRFEAFCELLQQAPPHMVLDRLHRILGLRQSGSYDSTAGDYAGSGFGSRNAESTGVPAARLALIEEGTTLARLAGERVIIEGWLDDVGHAQTEVLRMAGLLRKQFVIESLSAALQIRRRGASATRGAAMADLDDLLGRFTFATLEDCEQVRLSLEGEALLTSATEVVQSHLAATEAEYQRRAAEFREELKHARDKDRAVQECLTSVARTISQGMFSSENAHLMLEGLGMSEYIEHVQALVSGGSTGSIVGR